MISLILTLWTLSGYCNADIYKFVDEDGVIHLTNIPKGPQYKKVITEHVTRPWDDYNRIVNIASFKYGIDPSLIRALITVESNWDSSAVSEKGAIGLMQVMPSTAADMRIANPFDPEQNIEAGTRYLKAMLDRFNGDLDLALAAYNAGPAAVEKSGGIPDIAETRTYVRKVLSIHNRSHRRPAIKIYRVVNDNGSITFTDNPSGI